jgi:hypothetical protein
VDVTSAGAMLTSGDLGHAILAQSIGGGGGPGGNAGRVEVRAADTILVGRAAPTASGAPDSVLQFARATGLSAEGGYARGIVAQSIGGGGGNAGGAIAVGITSPASEATQLQLSMGSSGGAGGHAADALATLVGGVTTHGRGSDAMLVQSIGGGGGAGGFSASGSMAAASQTSARVSLGGSGAGGGNGAAASAAFQGEIRTFGDEARGIVVQSIGGGGGAGGMAIAANITRPTAGGNELNLGIGGSAAAGGDGGAVTLRTLAAPGERSTIATDGRDAHAIVAQSIGGGGGIGGLSAAIYLGQQTQEASRALNISIGGGGGGGGVGGTVLVENRAWLTTAGSNAHGILAQSIGGGGGAGGGAVTAMVRLDGTADVEQKNYSASVAVGGGGGDGNIAGAVTVTNTGRIVTTGDAAMGLVAQSIGGGGGAGGAANAVTLMLGRNGPRPPDSVGPPPQESKAVLNFAIAVGGGAGDGNDARLVTVANSALISTAGASATGILAQSIGGGGGVGGLGSTQMGTLIGPEAASAIDAWVIFNALGSHGIDRTGVANNFKIGVGGSGGASGNGGEVVVSNSGSVATAGDSARGLVAQSIGGGGGIGGQAMTGLLGKLSVGGEGRGGGDGATVTVANLASGFIGTAGRQAPALLAQSIGGGGGIGGSGGGAIVIGRSGGGGGAGGLVEVSNAGWIQTTGALSQGMLVQSIGGGGGLGGGSGLDPSLTRGTRLVNIGAASGSSGTGGRVEVANTGVVRTTGAASAAIVVQSIGGGGGVAATDAEGDPSLTDEVKSQIGRPVVSIGGSGIGGGSASAVTLRHAGEARTAGIAAWGLLAQSLGAGGGVVVGNGVNDFGATGGTGGSGGTAAITLAGGLVATTGALAHGVVAQSIGGGGGAAATLDQTPALPIPTATARLGARQVAGGNADAATIVLEARVAGGVTFQPMVTTAGDQAIGLLAQSIGGGGGISAIQTAQGISAQLGGDGGAWGNAGQAGITTGAGSIVSTTGQRAPAVMAQSIAGGGGWVSGSETNARLGTLPAALPVGTTTGNAGPAWLQLAGGLSTTGADSPVVLAQSIAAGGGMVGEVSGRAILGAAWADAATAGEVNLRAHATVEARGARAAGVVAQAIAGGGGLVATATGEVLLGITELGVPLRVTGGTVTLCGLPGVAGAGPCGVALATAAGTISALGDHAIAVVAQSIGGGGGMVGQAGGNATLGGVAEGRGGAVTLRGLGVLTAGTGGDTASRGGAAALAQSIGGGGGLVLTAQRVTLGGMAVPPPSAASNGGEVIVEAPSAIIGAGSGTLGLVAQSIGGGGGAVLAATQAALGGLQAGLGGTVRLSATGGATTAGVALLAQSIGGGGGLVARAAGAVALGGSGGGAGGSVALDAEGTVTTTGAGGVGLLAQSIGGGGGAVLGGAQAIALGGTQGGAGGAATVTSAAQISTRGEGAVGIVAQSIGGGGGLVAGTVSGIGGNLVAGGNTGPAAAGGRVEVTNTGSIATQGGYAHGILAQSIGGGGGAVLGLRPAGSTSVVLAGNGDGGAVSVTNRGSIVAAGHGIVAQSIGGGGLLAGEGAAMPGLVTAPNASASGRGAGFGGDVTIVNSARIQSTGLRGSGILAESLGNGRSGAIRLDLQPGSEVLGGAGGAGIRIRAQETPVTIDNAGSIGTADGIAGTAILAEGGMRTTLTNRGTITGSIDGAPMNVGNIGTGMFNAGARLVLGAGTFTNNAGFAVAGRGTIGTTQLSGHFRQGAAGTLFVDVLGRGTQGIAADLLRVSGTASLAGQVRAELMPGSAMAPGSYSAVVLRAVNGLTNAGATLASPNTLNTSWSLSFPNATEAVIGVRTTTTAPTASLTANQRSTAAALERAATVNTAAFAPYAAAVYGATDAAGYAASLSSLSGDGGLSALMGAQEASRQFTMGMTARLDLLQRSDTAGIAAPASFAPFALASSFEGAGPAGTMTGEALLGMDSLADVAPLPTRFWAMPLGGSGRMDAGAAFGAGVQTSMAGFMMGLDHRMSPDFVLGTVAGYSTGSYDAGSLISQSQLTGAHLGGYGMWRSGALYLSGTAAYSRHELKQGRLVEFGESVEYARASGGINNAALQLEMGWRMETPLVAVTPFAGIGLTAWSHDVRRETTMAAGGGGGMLGLAQSAQSGASVPLSLGLRLDGTTRFAGGLAMTPYLRAAWVHETGSSLSSTASLAMAPGETFRISAPRMPGDRLSFNAGLQLAPDERFGFGLGVFGDVGDGMQSIGGYGRAVVRW